jgi:hypothetical protein
MPTDSDPSESVSESAVSIEGEGSLPSLRELERLGLLGAAPLAIDYWIQIDCEPRRAFGAEVLAAHLRRLDRLAQISELDDVAMAAFQEEQFRLRPHAYHCRSCPANRDDRAYGCRGRVEFPITADAEAWLQRLLPSGRPESDRRRRELKAQRGFARDLALRLRELDVEGKEVDARRGVPWLLERRRPARWAGGGLFRRVRINTSALIEFMLLRPGILPEDAERVCRALGAWVDAEPAPDGTPEAIFTQPVEREDPPSVADLKQFLMTLMLASSLNAVVRTTLDAPALEFAGETGPSAPETGT